MEWLLLIYTVIRYSTSVEAVSDFEGKDDIAGKGNKLSTRSNEDGIELG